MCRRMALMVYTVMRGIGRGVVLQFGEGACRFAISVDGFVAL